MQSGLTTAGKIIFAYIGVAVIVSMLILLSARKPSLALVSGLAGIFISIGFLLIFADVARRDLRMTQQYRESQCTIVDSLARYTANADKSSRKRSGTWSPTFAVRYPTPAGETFSIARQADSALSFGGSKRTVDALAALPRGGKAPCWYDPDEPQQVVLDRSAGGAYAFALIPLLTLGYATFLLRRRRRN
jgi:hypothetical protein